jgi:hypothetical protein
MSAPANSQGAASGLENDLPQPSGTVIGADNLSGGTYSLMYASQTEFWT